MSSMSGSIAVYKALIDSGVDNDILDPFQRIVEATIFHNKIQLFSLDDIASRLDRDWQMFIPKMALVTILGRIAEKGSVKRHPYKHESYLAVDFKQLKESVDSIESHRIVIERCFKSLLDDFINYTLQESGVQLRTDEATRIIEAFISDHSSSISLNKRSPLDTNNVYFAEYFLKKCMQNEELMDLLKTISFGFILADSILIPNPQESTKFTDVYIILDTPLIFRILGINEVDEIDIYMNMVKSLQKQNAKVCVFNHNVEEVEKILAGSSYYIDNGNFDYSKASETLLFYMSRNSTKADIEEDILLLRDRLKDLGIDIINETYPESHYPFAKDLSKIKEAIVNVYKEVNPTFQEQDKQLTIDLDSKSINDTYILREGTSPINLSSCKAIFVTSNDNLVFASYRFNEQQGLFYRSSLSPCILDVTLGTYLWLDNPTMIKELAVKQLISQAYSIMTPNDALWARFVEELEKSESRGEITTDQLKALKTSTFVQRHLVKITHKDLKNVTSLTPAQVIQAFRQEGRNEAAILFDEEKAKIIDEKDKEKAKLASINSNQADELKEHKEHIDRIVKRKIKNVGILLDLVSLFGAAVGYRYIFYKNFDNTLKVLNLDFYGEIFIYSIAILAFAFIDKKSKINIYGYIYNKIFDFFSNRIKKKYSINK